MIIQQKYTLESAATSLRQAIERIASLQEAAPTGESIHWAGRFELSRAVMKDRLSLVIDSPQEVLALAAEWRKSIILQQMRALNQRSVVEHFDQAYKDLEQLLRDIRRQFPDALHCILDRRYQVLASLWLRAVSALEDYKSAEGQKTTDAGFQEDQAFDCEIISVIEKLFGDLREELIRNRPLLGIFLRQVFTLEPFVSLKSPAVPGQDQLRHSSEKSELDFQFYGVCRLLPNHLDRDCPETKEVFLASRALASAADVVRSNYKELALFLKGERYVYNGLGLELLKYKIEADTTLKMRLERNRSTSISTFRRVEQLLTAAATMRDKQLALAVALDKAVAEYRDDGTKVAPHPYNFHTVGDRYDGALVLICAHWQVEDSGRLLGSLGNWIELNRACQQARQDVQRFLKAAGERLGN